MIFKKVTILNEMASLLSISQNLVLLTFQVQTSRINLMNETFYVRYTF